MNFSILLNSRKRPELLKNLLDSIQNTTQDLSNIELFCSCDLDDGETLWFVENNKHLYPWANFEFLDREQNRNLVKRFNSQLKKSIGEYIWNINDDTEILTKNWDTISYDILNSQFKDGIKYGHIKCNSVDKESGGKYSSFPIHSKKGIDILGYYMTEKLPGLGGDVHLWRVYNEINRIVDLPVYVRHILHESIDKIINPDITALEMRKMTTFHENCWSIDISEDVNKLKEILNNQ